MQFRNDSDVRNKNDKILRRDCSIFDLLFLLNFNSIPSHKKLFSRLTKTQQKKRAKKLNNSQSN